MLESSPPKTKLQEYIVSVGNEAGYKTVTATVTGVSTETTTGLSTAWGQTEYSGGPCQQQLLQSIPPLV